MAAAEKLRKKGLSAYFALKRILNLKGKSMKVILKHFYSSGSPLRKSAFFAALNMKDFSSKQYYEKSVSDGCCLSSKFRTRH